MSLQGRLSQLFFFVYLYTGNVSFTTGLKSARLTHPDCSGTVQALLADIHLIPHLHYRRNAPVLQMPSESEHVTQ